MAMWLGLLFAVNIPRAIFMCSLTPDACMYVGRYVYMLIPHTHIILLQITIGYKNKHLKQNNTNIIQIQPLVPVHPIFDDDPTRYCVCT